MNQTKFEKLSADSNKLVTKIKNLCDKTGKPGTLKNFEGFEQVERLGNLLWEYGLKTAYVSDLLKETNYLKQEKDWSKVKPKLPSLSKKLQPYAIQHETVQSLRKVLDAAIAKVQEQRDFDILTKLINIMANLVQKIVSSITELKTTFKGYSIRKLVKDMEEFGSLLKKQGLKTNQIRKFLDAVNNLKLSIEQERKERKTDKPLWIGDYPKIDTELVLLKQKIAYAAAREPAVKPLKEVMDAAIDKVNDSEDFERFFQLIESIIAYHKAAGGKD